MSKDVKKRFEEKCIPEPNSGCWLWTGAVNIKGYGQIKINKKTQSAYRISYELYKGTIPPNMHIRHKCDNPLCVNPDHLILGTHNDNMQDMISRNRSAKGMKNYNNKLKENEVLHIYNSRLTNRELANYYTVDIESIRLIKKGIRWGWLTNS
jgi:HNH endonuclease